MNWLKKLTSTQRAASGLEYTLWRKLPLIAAVGTALPLSGLALVHLLADSEPSAAEARWLQMMDYMVSGVIIFHWSMVATVAIGCTGGKHSSTAMSEEFAERLRAKGVQASVLHRDLGRE